MVAEVDKSAKELKAGLGKGLVGRDFQALPILAANSPWMTSVILLCEARRCAT